MPQLTARTLVLALLVLAPLPALAQQNHASLAPPNGDTRSLAFPHEGLGISVKAATDRTMPSNCLTELFKIFVPGSMRLTLLATNRA